MLIFEDVLELLIYKFIQSLPVNLAISIHIYHESPVYFVEKVAEQVFQQLILVKVELIDLELDLGGKLCEVLDGFRCHFAISVKANSHYTFLVEQR